MLTSETLKKSLTAAPMALTEMQGKLCHSTHYRSIPVRHNYYYSDMYRIKYNVKAQWTILLMPCLQKTEIRALDS